MRDRITNDVKQYWLYAPGNNATFWEDFYDLEIMAIGWDEIGDLSKYGKKADIKNKMIEVYGAKNGSKAYMNYVQCTWDFANSMSIGDVVFVKQGLSKVLGYGIVTSDYYFDDDREEFCNVRTVNWKQKGVWIHPGQAVQKSLTNITQYTDYVEKLKLLFMDNNIKQFTDILHQKKNIILQGAPGTGKTYNTAALALSICGETIPESHEDVMKRYEELRKEGRIGFCTFHQSMDYEDFVEGIKPKTENGAISYDVEDGIFKELANRSQQNWEDSKKTVTEVKNESRTREVFNGLCDKIQIELNENDYVDLFSDDKSKMKISDIGLKKDGTPFSVRLVNSSSPKEGVWQGLTWDVVLRDYDDFKQGKLKSYKDVKPTYNSKSSYHGNAIYYFELYKRMREYEKTLNTSVNVQEIKLQNYVLIIDEINRGNVSKIFGELITLLEADKRIGGEHPIKVTLPYSKEPFGVPSNLYIIGTMNTTDRSVGNIDYAVRRRFAFVTLKADRQILVNKYGEKYDKKHPDMDIDDLMVGHSYFMADDDNELKLKLEYEIIPLIREYSKDGIINVKKNDLDKAFKDWKAAI